MIEHGSNNRIATPLSKPVNRSPAEHVGAPAIGHVPTRYPEEPRERLVAIWHFIDVVSDKHEGSRNHIFGRAHHRAPSMGIAQQREIVLPHQGY
jgi:hypothetical protein